MKKEEFDKLVNDPIATMIYNMDNWVIDPRIAVDTYHEILIDTMRTYLKALKEKDNLLASKCIAKFDELRLFAKLD